jgi:hypothetical protein
MFAPLTIGSHRDKLMPNVRYQRKGEEGKHTYNTEHYNTGNAGDPSASDLSARMFFFALANLVTTPVSVVEL